jgi:pantoate--beta-alanine ligase
MDVIETKSGLHELIEEWVHHGDHVALVPTMGNLHAGHLSLVEVAKEHAERVIVSIFVNPKQFGADEDLEDYPRSLEKDCLRLRKLGVDAVFAPAVSEIYPFGVEQAATVLVPGLKDDLCGVSRPDHFDGVTSVVARLFALVQPDVAVFGQKDFQQQLIIRRMTEDLNFPTRIVTASTVREDDGLALSSRNSYLSESERQLAPELHASLDAIASAVQDGQRDFDDLMKQGRRSLEDKGFDVDYFEIRRAQDLQTPDRDCDEVVILAAVVLGKARLIDNVVVTI